MKRIFLIIIVFVFSINIFSQQKKYTTYRVKEHETLFSIAKKLGVTTYELEKLNPDAKDGLHIDEVLIVPNKKYKRKPIVSSTINSKKKPIKIFQDSIKNGILYHKVKQGETIYSLSKKYKVKKKKLLKLNHLKKKASIKLGQILKIPTDKKDTDIPKKIIVIQDTVNDGNYISHTVLAGETKYSLARDNFMEMNELEVLNPFLKNRILKEGDVILLPKKKPNNVVQDALYTITKEDSFYNFEHNLGISKEKLLTLNPQLSEGLKVGMQIVLPQKELEEIDKPLLDYKTHQVAFQETYYKLGKLYGVTKEELIALNPELKDGLKEGMLIKVPLKLQVAEVNVMMEEDISGKNVNIVMLLPFKADHYVDFSRDSKETIFANKVTDFYFGALMAVDSLKQKGLNVNLKVLDTKNNTETVKKLAKTINFSNVDAVIGPMVYSKYKEFVKVFKKDSIPVISPVSKKNHALVYKSNVVQNTPKSEDIQKAMLQFIRDNYSNQNIIVVADESEEIETQLQDIQQFLKHNDSIDKITVLRMKDNQIKREDFDEKIVKDKENWVVLVTNPKQPTTTSVVVNSLGAYPKEFKITLFALERGKNFVQAELSNKNLNRLNVHFPLVTFVDNDNLKIQKFQQEYVNKFGSLPTEFSYKGFDTTYDAFVRLANAKKADKAFNLGKSHRLFDTFEYNSLPYQGYYNKGVIIVAMEDFKLNKVDSIKTEEIQPEEKKE